MTEPRSLTPDQSPGQAPDSRSLIPNSQSPNPGLAEVYVGEWALQGFRLPFAVTGHGRVVDAGGYIIAEIDPMRMQTGDDANRTAELIARAVNAHAGYGDQP